MKVESAPFGPNTADVRAVLEHAAVMLPDEAGSLAAAMASSWSYGRTDGRFPPFVAALGSACHVAVRSGRRLQLRAAREAVVLPAHAWHRSWPIARVGVRITVAAVVVQDLLTADEVALLLGPWRELRRPLRIVVRGAA